MRAKFKALSISVLMIAETMAFSGTVMASCPSITSNPYTTCIGTGAETNNTGQYGTALGYYALSVDNSTNNTATGYQSLRYSTSGFGNTANGSLSLYQNTVGNYNTAMGLDSLFSNTSGSYNVSLGFGSLNGNISGSNNTSTGAAALILNNYGSNNTASGYYSLYNNTTGNNNIALGYQAGQNLTTGSSNIDIGNLGIAAESATIRIGTQGTQTKAFMAGVRGVNVTGGSTVLVNASGQLGVASSSRRYKEDIQPMGDLTSRLMDLRPVTFRYKQADEAGNKPIQYGLIAEDVDTVMPELVVRDADGSPETVAYHVLPSLLLNVFQKQHQQLVETKADLTETKAKLTALEADMERMKLALDRLMAALPATTKLASVQQRRSIHFHEYFREYHTLMCAEWLAIQLHLVENFSITAVTYMTFYKR